MQYGSRVLFPLLLVGFLAACSSDGDGDGAGGSSGTRTGGSGAGGRGGSSSGTGGSSSTGTGGSSSDPDPGTGGSGSGMMTDAGAYRVEAGSSVSPKLGNLDQFVSPQASNHPPFSLVDGEGHVWWVDVDDYSGF